MTVSGLLVVCRPDHIEAVRADLSEPAWSEVHYVEPDGRMVVTVEAESTDEAIDRLSVLQRVPHVIQAEIVQHYVGDEELPGEDETALLARLNDVTVRGGRA